MGSKSESWVGDRRFWLSEMVLVWPWKRWEVGEAISTGRGVWWSFEDGWREERKVRTSECRDPRASVKVIWSFVGRWAWQTI